jgi:phosphatidylinositol-3-phosphatase
MCRRITVCSLALGIVCLGMLAPNHSSAAQRSMRAANRFIQKASAPLTVRMSTRHRPCAGRRPRLRYRHVIWIAFENKSFSQVIGSSNAPYINKVAHACGLATNFFAEAHPSLPNYIAMTSGSTQGITDDEGPSAHPLSVPSIFSQLGSHWKALAEDMPSNCHRSDAGNYAVRHNPAVYYRSVGNACLRQDKPLTRHPDTAARFTFITPNLCHDMHSCPTQSNTQTETRTGDRWLSAFLPKLLTTREYRSGKTVIFITWDEDDFHGSQHVPTLVVAPSVRRGARVRIRLDHYSMLRTTEQLMGLHRYLGRAASARNMARAFHLTK